MKLRFRGNSMRVRVNQKEVEALAGGDVLKERIEFPGSTSFTYILAAERAAEPQVSFADGRIRISAPNALITTWAASDDIGVYFTLATGGEPLKISIEKDLACIDGPADEKDPNAFPRELSQTIC